MSQRKVGDGHICPKRPIDAHMSQEKAGEGQLCPAMPREDQISPGKDTGSKGGEVCAMCR